MTKQARMPPCGHRQRGSPQGLARVTGRDCMDPPGTTLPTRTDCLEHICITSPYDAISGNLRKSLETLTILVIKRLSE